MEMGFSTRSNSREVDPQPIFGIGSAMRIALIVAVLIVAVLMIIAFPAINPVPGDEEINLIITFPKEGDEVWIDVVPPHVTVHGEVDAPSGIRSVVVQSEIGEVSCGNGMEFACPVPVSSGKNKITVIATDNLGNQAEKSLNVTIRSGPPPPLLIIVLGYLIENALGYIIGIIGVLGALLIFLKFRRRKRR